MSPPFQSATGLLQLLLSINALPVAKAICASYHQHHSVLRLTATCADPGREDSLGKGRNLSQYL